MPCPRGNISVILILLTKSFLTLNNFLFKQYHVLTLFIFLLKLCLQNKNEQRLVLVCHRRLQLFNWFYLGFEYTLWFLCLQLNYKLKSFPEMSSWLKNLSASTISIFADIRKSTFWSVIYTPATFPGWCHHLLPSLTPFYICQIPQSSWLAQA